MKDFEKIIWRDSLTLFDFFATWCEPCQTLLPEIDRVSDRMRGRVDVYKIDVDDRQMQDILRHYHIQSVPTLLFFRRGEVVHRISGVTNYAHLVQTIKDLEKEELAKQL